LTLRSSAGSVAGALTLSAQNTVATFTPAAALAAETTFTVALTAGIGDLADRALQPFTSSFTTVDVTPPPIPPAGQISASLPNNGVSQVIGTQGTLEPGSLIIVTNATTGETGTGTAETNGSFRVNLHVTLAGVYGEERARGIEPLEL
jgi:hypothetical protein